MNNRFENVASASWPKLVSESGRHRVAPLFYKKIKQAGAEKLIPSEALNALRKQYLATAAYNTVLFSQLNELVASLNCNNIPVMLLKGAHLAQFVYKDIALRPMADIDILVKEEHLSEAVQIAFEAGFGFYGDEHPEKKKNLADFDYGIMPHAKHFKALLHPETKSLLEIHCSITSKTSPFKIDSLELWNAAQKADLENNTVFLLSSEDLILHLCLHAAYDDVFSNGIGAIYDISETINASKPHLNWGKIKHRSGRWKTDRSLSLALYFTRKYLAADIPEKMLGDFPHDALFNLAEERIFKTNNHQPLPLHLSRWRDKKGLRQKMKYFREVLLPPKQYMADRYLQPSNSRFLFRSYLFRWYQAVQGIFGIVVAALKDSRYKSRQTFGDDNLRLKNWLAD